MRKSFTLQFIAFTLFSFCFSAQIKGQTLQSYSANLINNLAPRIPLFTGANGLKKSSSCGGDTVNYTFNKTTILNTVSLNNVSSANSFAQWYPAPQAITVSGFEFFAWQTAMSSAVVTLTCRIYNAGIDSMPVGSPLASVTVNVDSTFGGGTLTTLRKKAIFSSPITTSNSNGYVLTVETSSGINVAVVTNSWTATPPNGRAEWLSSVKIGTSFIRSYNINIGGIIFNADFIMQPFVNYNLNAAFTSSANCLATGIPMTFTNTSSPVLFNKFYSVRAFFNIPQFSCIWDYGDTTGISYSINGAKTYYNNNTYRVRLQDTLYGWTNGCGDTYYKDIYQSPDPTNANNNSPICASGTLKLFADSIPGAGYYWTGPNGFTSTQRNPEIPSAGLAASGSYSVQTVIAQCSSSVATTYVSVTNSYSASSNGPLCVGQNLSLNATPITGATYTWVGPNSFTSSLRNPIRNAISKADSGNYQVTISLAGCGILGPFNTLAVINDNPISPTAGNNGPLCVGQALNLTATGPVSGTYNWTGPNSFNSTQQNPVRTGVSATYAGSYSVVLTQNGCSSAPASTIVVINSIPTAPSAGNNGPLCSGQTLSLTASLISGASYVWSGPNGFTSTSQNPTRTGLSLLDAGTYSVIASVSGCASAAANTSVTITSTTPIPSAISNGPLCPGQNLQLTATAIAGATFNWTGPKGFTSTQQNPIITNVNDSNAGIYSVTATTSACGTSSSANVTLVVNALPTAPSVGNNGPICEGQNLNLTASAITGASYVWTGPNGFSSNSQNPILSNMSKIKGGTYSVYVNVAGCGTSNPNSTNVIVHATPNVPTAGSNSPICFGDTIRFSANLSGLGPNASYSWTGPNNYSVNGANAKINSALMSDAGIYSVTVSDSGCSSQSGSVSITVKTLPTAPIPSSNGPICAGANLNLQASTISGAVYNWSGPNGFQSSAQNPSITAASSSNTGSYFVKSIVNGCSSIPASLGVLINALPDPPTASNTGPGCVGDNINLKASSVAGASYNWSGPSFSSTLQNPILVNASKLMSGSYAVSVNVNGCNSIEAKTDVIINTIPDAPILSSNPALSVCTGDSLQLFASNLTEGVFEWTGPLGFGSAKQNPVLFISTTAQAGAYTAQVSRYGCASTKASLNISVHSSPNTSNINGLTNVKSAEAQTYSVTATAGSSYDWTVTGGTIESGTGTPSISVLWGPKGTGMVKVSETNAAACKGIGKNLSVAIGPAAGINDAIALNNLWRIYPNPAENFVLIDFNSSDISDAQIQIIDISGRTIETFQLAFIETNKPYKIDLKNYEAGIYFVKMITKEKEGIKKLLRN